MKRRDEYVEPVVKLMRRTAEGEIDWRPKTSIGMPGFEPGGDVFEAKYRDRIFRLYDARAFFHSHPSAELSERLLAALEPNHYYLEVIDPANNVMRFPQLRVINDLAQIVKGRRPEEDLEELNRLLDEE